LTVNFPNWGWWGYEDNGRITEPIITVKPLGAYMNIEMYLRLGDFGNYYQGEPNMQIVLDFSLPENAIIHDSWLWMLDDSTIVRAEVMDRWSAINIFNDIVGVNEDPSILYRVDGDNYQIRIFPLTGGETRKIKISYLVPAIWSESDIRTWLPTNILNTSADPIDAFKLIYFPTPHFQNPRILGTSGADLVNVQDGVFGQVMATHISGDDLNKPLQLVVDSPLEEEEIFVQRLGNGDEKFYQMAYLPPELPSNDESKKIMFLFDYEADNSVIDKDALFQYVIDK